MPTIGRVFVACLALSVLVGLHYGEYGVSLVPAVVVAFLLGVWLGSCTAYRLVMRRRPRPVAGGGRSGRPVGTAGQHKQV